MSAVSAALFSCLSPLLQLASGDSFQSSGCFEVSSNYRTNGDDRCKNGNTLATFDSVQQMDELASDLDPGLHYHVAVFYDSGQIIYIYIYINHKTVLSFFVFIKNVSYFLKFIGKKKIIVVEIFTL